MGDAISSLLFQPPPPTYLHPSRHFWLNTATGSRIPAFFIERPNAQVTILFSHGNAEDLGMIYDWFNDLARVLRVNIMAYDYTGYGKSNGAPCEENCYADIDAAYQYLLDVRRLQPEQIVLYGRSLGSGPSCFLAQKSAKEGKSVGGVILQSPLLSAYRVAFDFRFTMVGDKVCMYIILYYIISISSFLLGPETVKKNLYSLFVYKAIKYFLIFSLIVSFFGGCVLYTCI